MSNWIEKFAEASVPVLKKAVRPGRIGEITQGAGRFSSQFLSLLPENVQLFRTDSPMQDYNSLALARSVRDSYVVPGSIYRQLYPSGSMDLVYAFQVFNQFSTPVYTKDHLIPSLSKFPLTLKQVERVQDNDMNLLLRLRYQELKVEGGLVFDVILKPEESEQPYSWDCLDLAVQLALDELGKEAKGGANLQTSFRNLDQVKKVLSQFVGMFEVSEFNETTVLFPGYEDYLKNQDIDRYIETLLEFWAHPIKLMSKRLFKDENKEKAFIEKVNSLFKEICKDMKPKSEQRLLVVSLKKIISII